ncbi:putative WSC domain-containing protein 1 [Apostichopus japonicus]|uniref:Putative WSC domain-containing protein 1 n=1 Tax=Stichopus japonicus TaxID=307972 RepID=A0A2G8KFJ3_STIJA|nr:putative WSC domain-containing protein 1 [Apostichopus japonicus]
MDVIVVYTVVPNSGRKAALNSNTVDHNKKKDVNRKRNAGNKKKESQSFVLANQVKPEDNGKPYIDTPEREVMLHQKVVANGAESDCTDVKVAPKGSMRLRLLYSSEGSGSTWLRYLLELTSGYYTGSHYRDSQDYMAGFHGESLDPLENNILIVKSNGPNVTKVFEGGTFESAIILIRNPFDTIISSFYKYQHETIGTTDKKIFQSEEWTKFTTMQSQKWFYGALCTCMIVHPSITVYYEDLVSNTESELRRILTFLNVNASSERMKCAMSHSKRVFRKYEGRSEKLNIDPYTDEMKVFINNKIQALRRQFGFKDCGVIPQYEVIPSPQVNQTKVKETG